MLLQTVDTDKGSDEGRCSHVSNIGWLKPPDAAVTLSGSIDCC